MVSAVFHPSRFMNEANLGARSGRAAAKVKAALFDATLAAILLFSLS